MEYQIISPEQRQIGTWSGGSTEQLFIWPPQAQYSERRFAWRVSTAVVNLEESDFTPLDGFTRWIMPLQGQLYLQHQGHGEKTLPPLTAHCFEGGWTTHSVGKCTDFNLMLGSGWEGYIDANPGTFSAAAGGFVGVFAHGGPLSVKLQSPSGEQQQLELQTRDFLVAHGPLQLTVVTKGQAVAFVATPTNS